MTPLRTYREPEARALGLLEDEVADADRAPTAPASRSAVLDEIRRRTVIK